MRYTITTPLPGITGEHAGVHFANGTAVIDDTVKEQAAALAYFQSAGYGVEEIEDKPKRRARQQEAPPAASERPGDNASTEEWRAFAVAMGMTGDEANAKTRDELVALYPKEAGQ